MPESFFWIILLMAGCLILVAGIAVVKGFGLVKIGWLNISRMKELRSRAQNSQDPLERRALELVLQHCSVIKRKWILDEGDLRVGEGTLRLLENIAGVYHAGSDFPLSEVRLGKVLEAFLELKDRIHALSGLKGVSRLTQFRLRHVFFLSRAWRKKESLRRSPVGQAVGRYKLWFKGLNFLFRYMDLSFWIVKMAGYFLNEIAFKVLMIRWYLMVGDLAAGAYSDRELEPDLPVDEILGDLDSVPEPEPEKDLSEGVKSIVEAHRKSLLFSADSTNLNRLKDTCLQLTEDIARHHHPESERPLQEARLFDLMAAVAKLAEKTADIGSKPVLNRLMDIRVSRLLQAKNAVDVLKDNEILAWLRKYHLHKVVRYSTLIYKVVRKKHPGILVKEFGFILAKEGLKRWVCLHLMEKIGVEVNTVYRIKHLHGFTKNPSSPLVRTDL